MCDNKFIIYAITFMSYQKWQKMKIISLKVTVSHPYSHFEMFSKMQSPLEMFNQYIYTQRVSK